MAKTTNRVPMGANDVKDMAERLDKRFQNCFCANCNGNLVHVRSHPNFTPKEPYRTLND